MPQTMKTATKKTIINLHNTYTLLMILLRERILKRSATISHCLSADTLLTVNMPKRHIIKNIKYAYIHIIKSSNYHFMNFSSETIQPAAPEAKNAKR